MDEPDPLYCEVFVESDLTEADLTSLIRKLVNGEQKRWSIQSDLCEIEVQRNKRIMQPASGERSFVNFPYYLDIFPTPPARTNRSGYVEAVGKLLEGLWGLGYDAVAACDFEDELPRFGGYNSEERPRTS